MPHSAPHPCAEQGCRVLLRRGARCVDHTFDAQRQNANARLYDAWWQRERKAYLAEHRTCVDCSAAATHVDHVRAHRGDVALFRDKRNWQPMCGPCHSRKTNRYDGGFGRGRAGQISTLPPQSTTAQPRERGRVIR